MIRPQVPLALLVTAVPPRALPTRRPPVASLRAACDVCVWLASARRLRRHPSSMVAGVLPLSAFPSPAIQRQARQSQLAVCAAFVELAVRRWSHWTRYLASGRQAVLSAGSLPCGDAWFEERSLPGGQFRLIPVWWTRLQGAFGGSVAAWRGPSVAPHR